MQGWRSGMEDSHSCILNVPSDPETSFFGIYDGHGGIQVSKFLQENLIGEIITKQSYLFKHGRITDAIRQGFINTDKLIKKTNTLNPKHVGSTANVVIIRDDKIYCANTGDSRAVASIYGHAAPLSFDHKPGNIEEKRRIEATGGWIRNNRVNGCLAVSRAFGDHTFKSNSHQTIDYQSVTCYPDITVKDITPEIEFIVIACDGIWEVKNNQEVVDFIRMQIGERIQPTQILKNLCMECVASPSSTVSTGFDNMSVILISFLFNKSHADFSERCMMPKEIGLDPYMFVLTLESGPYNSTNGQDSINPRRQRRWGFPHMNAFYQTQSSADYTEIQPALHKPHMDDSVLADTAKLTRLLRQGDGKHCKQNNLQGCSTTNYSTPKGKPTRPNLGHQPRRR